MRHAPLLALIALLFLPQAAPAAEEPGRTLQVAGTGEVSAAPDLANIDVGVTSDAGTARAALDANSAAMRRVMEALSGLDIAERDVQTRGFNVEPRYHYDQQNREPPRVVGYRVSNTVHVTVRDLDRLGEVLDTVVTEGSNTINGLAFSFDDPEALMDEARRRAAADARRKAELLAGSLGVELGPVARVSEVEQPRPPVPMMMRAAPMEAADVPVARGEQTLSASVTVTWSLE